MAITEHCFIFALNQDFTAHVAQIIVIIIMIYIFFPMLLSYNCAFEVCYSEHKELTTMLLTTLWSNSPWNKTHCWTNKISEAPSFEKTSSWSEMLTSFYYFKAKHITEMIVDGGSLLYKSIYFLILMYWQEPKENVIKLVNV